MVGKPHAGTVRDRPITVVLIDDEALIRSALAQALSGGGLDLIGDADNARGGIELVTDLRPDVAVMDIKLRGSGGVRAIERIALLAPASKVLVLTRTEHNQVVEAIVAGASGYILKTSPPSRSSLPSKPPPRAKRCSPHRSPGSCSSESANATLPSRRQAKTPPRRFARC